MNPLSDHVQLTIAAWTTCLMSAHLAGLAVGLRLRRPTARRRAESVTVDCTETVRELAKRCRS